MKYPKFRLLRTTAVKLAIKSIMLYGLLLLLLLGALYWSSGKQIDQQIKTELEQEIIQLQETFNTHGSTHLITQITTLEKQEDHIYFYKSFDNKKLAGNLHEWPEDSDIELDGITHGFWIEEDIIPISIYDDDAYWPLVATEFSDGSQLLIGRNVEQAKYLLEFSEFMLEALGFSILFATIIAFFLGRKILGRMDVISATASEIMAGDLSRRVPVKNNQDEFDTLARRLNSMLDRIQQLIKGIREVTDNIAHDLRSPLTRMRNQMEITLLEPRSPEEYQKVLRNNIEDIESLIRTFNALLSIAQAEAGNHREKWSQVNLKQLAVDLMELYTPLAEEKQQTLEVFNGNDSFINGSRVLLAQSFGNLLENAIKYTPIGGQIKLRIRTSVKHVEVIVEDSGHGIPEAERSHVLEKFVRLEDSRNEKGNGLGLSLVAAVASLHKAELILDDAAPGLQVIQRFNKV